MVKPWPLTDCVEMDRGEGEPCDVFREDNTEPTAPPSANFRTKAGALKRKVK